LTWHININEVSTTNAASHFHLLLCQLRLLPPRRHPHTRPPTPLRVASDSSCAPTRQRLVVHICLKSIVYVINFTHCRLVRKRGTLCTLKSGGPNKLMLFYPHIPLPMLYYRVRLKLNLNNTESLIKICGFRKDMMIQYYILHLPTQAS
jgi:hypothetical protein